MPNRRDAVEGGRENVVNLVVCSSDGGMVRHPSAVDQLAGDGSSASPRRGSGGMCAE